MKTKLIGRSLLLLAAVVVHADGNQNVAAKGASTAPASGAETAGAGGPPNILLFFADDWGRYASCYSDPDRPSVNDVVETPSLDSLARNGLMLPNTFCSAPSCSPSRGALLTGRHFYMNYAFVNLGGTRDRKEQVEFSKLPQFTTLMNNAGYYIGLAYKTLPVSGEHITRYGTSGKQVSKFSETVMPTSDPKARAELIFQQLRQDFEQCLDDAQGAEKPFLFMSGPHNTHRPWINRFGREFWGINPDDLKGKLPAYLPDVPVIREDMADYLGEVQVLDRYMEEYLKILRERGLLDNTLIIATGDNGIPGFPRGKMNCYPAGIEQGMLVQWPGVIQPGRVADDMVNLIDIAPTFYEIAGIPIPEEVEGRSLLNVFQSAQSSGQVDPERMHIVAGRERHGDQAREGNLPYPTRTWREHRYQLIKNFAPDRWPNSALPGLKGGRGGDTDTGPTVQYYIENAEKADFQKYLEWAHGKRPELEFYDLQKDPDCLNNLADNPEFAPMVQEYERKLMTHLKATGDRRVLGDGTTFDKLPFTKPWR